MNLQDYITDTQALMRDNNALRAEIGRMQEYAAAQHDES